jgi:cytochrome c553
MNKITILSIITASILLVGCGEESKKATTEATTKAVETTKEATDNALKASKEAADKAVEVAKEATQKAVEASKKAAEATKEAAVKAVETVEKAAKETVADAEGAKLYAKCSGCHGADGKTKALGKSPEIAGQSKEELVTKLNAYKAGTRNEAGMGTLMKGQVASMDDKSIAALAAYISTLK